MNIDPPPFLKAPAPAPADSDFSNSLPTGGSEGEGPSPALSVDSSGSNSVTNEGPPSNQPRKAPSPVDKSSSSSSSSSVPATRRSARSSIATAGKNVSEGGSAGGEKAPPKKRKSEGCSVENEKGAKKAKAADPLVIPLPEGAPAWFNSALRMFQPSGPDLGEEWMGLVRVWAQFEGQAGYMSQGNLGSLHRPKVVADWIKRARSATWRPILGNISNFEDSYCRWWSSLQPAWRRFEDGSFGSELVDGNWSEMNKLGPNGLLSTLAALFFWGTLAVGNDEVRQRWLLFVKDFTVVLNHLI